MPRNEPSTPAKGGTRDFWAQHSISPDSTRLKKDIDKDHAEHIADSKVISSGKAGPQETKMRERRAQEGLDRETARRDTLDQIRKVGKKR